MCRSYTTEIRINDVSGLAACGSPSLCLLVIYLVFGVKLAIISSSSKLIIYSLRETVYICFKLILSNFCIMLLYCTRRINLAYSSKK